MRRVDTDILTTCRENLWYDADELRDRSFTQAMIDRLVRIRDIYNWWLQYPTKRERDVVNEIVSRYGINRTYAYRDVAILRSLLGDLGKQTKDFVRFQFNAMITETYELAKKKGDTAAMVAAADKYAKYNQLDKAEQLDVRWENIQPQIFEVSDDPTTIGFKPIPNIRERIKKKIEQYWTDNIEEVRYVDLTGEEDKDGGEDEEVL